MQLSIVIPTYNEAENLPQLISALFALPLEGTRVLVVDDNSPDGTGALVEELRPAYQGRLIVRHRAGKLGLGSAYLEGFQQMLDEGAEAVAQMDADFSHPPEKLVALVAALEKCDVALGSRYVPGGSLDERWPAWRRGLSAFGNLYARMILGIPVRDVTGGFRVWRRHTLRHMPMHLVRSNGYAFQVEMAYLAYRSGFTFEEVPIHFADRRWGQSKMSLRIQAEAALRVWQFWLRYRKLALRR